MGMTGDLIGSCKFQGSVIHAFPFPLLFRSHLNVPLRSVFCEKLEVHARCGLQ